MVASVSIKRQYIGPRQNGRHFANDILKSIFFIENAWISNKCSLNFLHNRPIYNKSALDQVMAWHQTGGKPLTYPMMTQFNYAYMRHPASMS